MYPALERRQTRLEAEIVVAWELVKTARRAWAHSPNGDTISAAEQALADVDLLLDEYLDLPRR